MMFWWSRDFAGLRKIGLVKGFQEGPPKVDFISVFSNLSADQYSFLEAPKVRVADTVGAGDAFTAVFIAGILKGYPLTEVHQKAMEIAAFVCTKKGATPKISFIHEWRQGSKTNTNPPAHWL